MTYKNSRTGIQMKKKDKEKNNRKLKENFARETKKHKSE